MPYSRRLTEAIDELPILRCQRCLRVLGGSVTNMNFCTSCITVLNRAAPSPNSSTSVSFEEWFRKIAEAVKTAVTHYYPTGITITWDVTSRAIFVKTTNRPLMVTILRRLAVGIRQAQEAYGKRPFKLWITVGAAAPWCINITMSNCPRVTDVVWSVWGGLWGLTDISIMGVRGREITHSSLVNSRGRLSLSTDPATWLAKHSDSGMTQTITSWLGVAAPSPITLLEIMKEDRRLITASSS